MSWTNYLKKGLASAVIILLGIVVFFAFGFNKSFDFTGGTIVSVNAKTTAVAQAQTKVNEVLAQHNNINITSFSVGSANGENIVTVKYQIATNIDATNDMVLEEIYAAFGYDKTDIVEKNFVNMTTNIEPAFGISVFSYALMGILLALAVAAFYMWLRFGLPTAMVLVAAVIVDILCAIAFMAIFRIGISSNIGYAILAVGALSLIFNTLMLSKLKANAFEVQNKKLPNSEVADLTSQQLTRPFVGFAAIFAFILLVFAIMSFGPTGSAVFAIAMSLVSIIITSLFITPNLWQMVFVRRVREKRKPMPEVESEVE